MSTSIESHLYNLTQAELEEEAFLDWCDDRVLNPGAQGVRDAYEAWVQETRDSFLEARAEDLAER